MEPDTYPLLGYAVEKYGSAVRKLAVLSGDVRGRIRAGLPDVLLIDPTMVPNHENVRADIAYIHKQLTRFGDVSTTLRKIRTVTGSRIAARIFDAHFKLQQAQTLELARTGLLGGRKGAA